MPQVHPTQNPEEEILEEEEKEEEEQSTPLLEEPRSGLPIIPFLLSLVAFIPLAVVVGYFLSVGDIKNTSEMAARTAMRTPVYFLSHGGVSCAPFITISLYVHYRVSFKSQLT